MWLNIEDVKRVGNTNPCQSSIRDYEEIKGFFKLIRCKSLHGSKGCIYIKKENISSIGNQESDWMGLFTNLKVWSSLVYIRIICSILWNFILGLQPRGFWFKRWKIGPWNLNFNKYPMQESWRPHFEKYWRRRSQRSICTSISLSHLFTLKVFSWILVRTMSKEIFF